MHSPDKHLASVKASAAPASITSPPHKRSRAGSAAKTPLGISTLLKKQAQAQSKSKLDVDISTTSLGESTAPIFDMQLHLLPDRIQAELVNLHHFDLPGTINAVLATSQPPMKASPFTFERSTLAATKNSMLLHQYNFDVEKAMQSVPGSIMDYGAEFRPTSVLEPLLQHHQQWPAIKDILTNGARYPLRPISESDRLGDIEYMLERGNHKSAEVEENKKALHKSFDKEVGFHWMIPLNTSVIPMLEDACITPLGVAVQWTINEFCERVLKRRTTHDCSFPGQSGESCNLRVRHELLDECRFGHALRRFLHGIHSIRLRFPFHIIGISKTDLDSAYRRIHASIKAALSSITVLDDIAYLLVRLPFGSAPAPSIFSSISDTAADLAQDLCLDPSWDPTTLHSSFNLNFPTEYEEPSVPFAPADPLAMQLPPREIVTDNLIDDIFQAGALVNDNEERIRHSVPLILEAMFRPLHPDDEVPRNPIISMKKQKAEGALAERKVILGWLIDTRRFRVFLTPEKHADWVQDIDFSLKRRACSKELLHRMIGRFNHTSVIIHIGRYFLTRLRHRLLQNDSQAKHHQIKLLNWEIKDLELWRFFLRHLCSKGVSINNICNTQPSVITYSDACEWGIGGFTSIGTAWRYQIPPALWNRASINLLEFIAAIVTIEMSITFDYHPTTSPHILAYTDSSSALGWLYHSTFNPVQNPCHDDVARYLARLLFQKEASLYSEHVKGEDNLIADSLSRDFHWSDTEILTHLSSQCTQQVPSTLHLRPIPRKISCWIVSVLDSLTPKTGLLPVPKPSSFATSRSTAISSAIDATSMMSSSTPSRHNKKISSCAPSRTASETTSTEAPTKTVSKGTLLTQPSHMWFRPSGRTFGLTPHWMQKATDQPSSNDNQEGTETKTLHQITKPVSH